MVNPVRKLIEAVEEAEASGYLIAPAGPGGLAGEKTAGLLQRCARLAAARSQCYLEVGVFQGFTLSCVAAAVPEAACFGIDNFSQFDPLGRNRSIVETRLRAQASVNARLIDQDFEEALTSLPTHIGEQCVGVYFVDGPHDYRSQFLCLELARPYLSEEAVIVVDDSNYEHVRRANADWLRCNPEFALLFETYSGAHPDNLPPAALASARKGWWNGINVMVRDRLRLLERTFPPVDASRQRYFNDHLVHPARYAELAPQVLDVLGALSLKSALRLVKLFMHARSERAGRYPRTNTYSEALPSRRIVQPRSDRAVDG